MMVSGLHNVCQKGYYVAIISTIVETNNPKAELEPAFELIGHNKETEIFFSITDQYVATSNGTANQVFVSNSFDPSSHFEAETEAVLRIYKTITGEDIDLDNLPEDVEQ